MSQQISEIAKVKNRILALSNKTVDNGCSEAEAMSAAAKVGELLDQYNLSMSEIEMRQEVCVEGIIQNPGKNRRPIDGCMVTIAKFCDCKVWLHIGLKQYIFFGLESDVMMAKYLYAVINRSINTEVALFKANGAAAFVKQRGDLRTATNSFQKGMVRRINARLLQIIREREATVKAAQSTGTSLVLVKNQIIEEAYADRMKATKLRTPVASKRRVHGAAYNLGNIAGEKVNLSRPLNDSDTKMIG